MHEVKPFVRNVNASQLPVTFFLISIPQFICTIIKGGENNVVLLSFVNAKIIYDSRKQRMD